MPQIAPDVLARQIGTLIMIKDRASSALGMRIEDIGPGEVTLSMTVRPDMINGHDLCHGGYIFTLADSACAIASNNRNTNMVLQTSTITYLKPGRLGDRLTAIGIGRSFRGRSGVVDVVVHNQDGTEIALFRGVVRSIPGHSIPERAAPIAEQGLS